MGCNRPGKKSRDAKVAAEKATKVSHTPVILLYAIIHIQIANISPSVQKPSKIEKKHSVPEPEEGKVVYMVPAHIEPFVAMFDYLTLDPPRRRGAIRTATKRRNCECLHFQ